MAKKILFQSMSPNDCELQAVRVDVWQIPLNDCPDWARSLLNTEEQTRADRFYFPQHQRRFTVSRATLRLILAQYLNQSPTSLDFSMNAHGKPALQQQSIQFNMSHSGETALIAIGKDHELGVDLEYFSARSLMGIAQHVFSNTEIETLTAQHDSVKPLSFFTIWAQKEAFIKAVGMGLAYPLKKFSVRALPGDDYDITDPLTKNQWRLSTFMPAPACSAALCVNPFVQDYRYIKLQSLKPLEALL